MRHPARFSKRPASCSTTTRPWERSRRRGESRRLAGSTSPAIWLNDAVKNAPRTFKYSAATPRRGHHGRRHQRAAQRRRRFHPGHGRRAAVCDAGRLRQHPEALPEQPGHHRRGPASRQPFGRPRRVQAPVHGLRVPEEHRYAGHGLRRGLRALRSVSRYGPDSIRRDAGLRHGLPVLQHPRQPPEPPALGEEDSGHPQVVTWNAGRAYTISPPSWEV